jgi:hypothetical protein
MSLSNVLLPLDLPIGWERSRARKPIVHLTCKHQQQQGLV